MYSGSPLFWPVTGLIQAFRRRELSPVEVTKEAIARIETLNPTLNAFLTVTADLAMDQARGAERAYSSGDGSHLYEQPLLGVPVSVKDLFLVRGAVATLGSLVHATTVARADSGSVSRLRAAGAVFVGKTNTAEFGQSATTENRLGGACRNPWNPALTAGGSSGGAAVSVAVAMSSLALGSDGGGSIRIPAAFCGLVGIKPTFGKCPDERGFRGMTAFACPGPLARRVEDARLLLGVLADRRYPRRQVGRGLHIGWYPAPEGRPVDPRVASAVEGAVRAVAALGHRVSQVGGEPFAGWPEIFGPLVLADEWHYRRHLLATGADSLTEYELRSLKAAAALTRTEVVQARRGLRSYRQRFRMVFEDYDLVLTPTTSVPAFPVEARPRTINGTPVDALWGGFPFTAPVNVSGCPAASVPCGLAGGLPVGIQVIGPPDSEQGLLDFCADLEEAVRFDDASMRAQWARAAAPAGAQP